ncbi:Gfo/Idh/MocA family oxidoreductase [Limimaricola sp.]|uniref:Gfo/Idh/MocA family protein n=1 Tax=Limimaricola sp. TaxID=2211665 RepID=UPI0025BA546F|nr:Gfo/Idh/MocA family oxidoreductase [Limimaricola sp.]
MYGLDIAIVGAGAIVEKFYLPALAKLRGKVRRIGVIDLNLAQREMIATAYDLIPFGSLEAAAAAGFRAAIIAVPNRFHAPVTHEALRLGMDVLVEKPLADSHDEAKEMVDLAANAGRILAVNQTRRLFGTSRFIRDAIAAGTYGELRSVRYEEGAPFKWTSVDGAYTQTNLGRVGVIADLGSHVLDVIAWWTDGMVGLVRCRHDGWAGPEAFAHIELGGMAEASVKISRLGRMNNYFEVQFEDARLFGDIYNWSSINIEQQGHLTRETIDTQAKTYADMGDVLLTDFIAAVACSRDPLFPAERSIAGMKLIDDCYNRAEKFEYGWYAPSNMPGNKE